MSILDIGPCRVGLGCLGGREPAACLPPANLRGKILLRAEAALGWPLDRPERPTSLESSFAPSAGPTIRPPDKSIVGHFDKTDTAIGPAGGLQGRAHTGLRKVQRKARDDLSHAGQPDSQNPAGHWTPNVSPCLYQYSVQVQVPVPCTTVQVLRS